mmetsp:Transcript_10478/g.29661  ORF Transcript_10478/g.29661 Transcript_10478/m.29661 type:complete len:219 (-) Transcript_10478:198-854(-)
MAWFGLFTDTSACFLSSVIVVVFSSSPEPSLAAFLLRTCCQRFDSLCFLTGLARNSTAPFWIHFAAVSMLSWLLITVTGSFFHLFEWTTLSRSWSPLTSGIRISVNIMSIFSASLDLRMSSASLPFSAAITLYPQLLSAASAHFLATASSSTRRTHIFVIASCPPLSSETAPLPLDPSALSFCSSIMITSDPSAPVIYRSDRGHEDDDDDGARRMDAD